MKVYILLLLIVNLNVFAHGKKKHDDLETEVKKELTKDSILTKKYNIINQEYLRDVKQIFITKCFDCHGDLKKLPWYYSVPGVKQLINSDMKKAKIHLDLRGDFPFKSHSTPKNDLYAIKHSVDKNKMPPLRYRVMHKNSAITDSDKNLIYNWIEKSIKLLSEDKK